VKLLGWTTRHFAAFTKLVGGVTQNLNQRTPMHPPKILWSDPVCKSNASSVMGFASVSISRISYMNFGEFIFPDAG
jgi:hypothetical protein